MSKKIFIVFFVLLLGGSFAQGPSLRILKSLNQHDRPVLDKVMIRNGYKRAISIGLATIMSASIKRIIKRPRPYVTYPDDVVKRDRDGGPFSFPSGHTTSAF